MSYYASAQNFIKSMGYDLDEVKEVVINPLGIVVVTYKLDGQGFGRESSLGELAVNREFYNRND